MDDWIIEAQNLAREDDPRKNYLAYVIEDKRTGSPIGAVGCSYYEDLGKVGIPDAILNKPGRFTDDEYAIMKTHSEIGYNMLHNSKRKLLRFAADIARSHHERWDGRGYPKGLAGEEIPLAGRICSVADVLDALSSPRCYKQPWPEEKVKEEFGIGSSLLHITPLFVERLRAKYTEIFTE